ncbi:MAG: hypothetical protein IKK57_11925, partial [Clostridia bacterium]|nr:hypothetical protein [Clostridia bacterium]
CPNCGTKMENAEQPRNPDASSYYTKQEEGKTQPAPQQTAAQPDQSQYKMGYHKFMVYFMMWFWAAICVVNCISGPYVDFYGVCCLAYGVLAVAYVYVRFQLARFKTNAPKKLLYTVIAYAAVTIIASIVAADMSGTELDPSSVSGPVLFVGAWGIGSWRYYSSRSELFVN